MEEASSKMSVLGLVAVVVAAGVGACGGEGGGAGDGGESRAQDLGARVALVSHGPNMVSRWDEVAASTINGSGTAATTPEEQMPVYAVDMATVHVAMYDALAAIAGTH